MSNFGITRADALLHRGAEGVVDMHEHHRLRRLAGSLEHFLLVGEGVAQDHRRGREIAEHELVALLGDRRRRRDVDDERNALLLGHLGDRGALAGIEGADQELRAVVDQFLGARARHLHVGLGVGIHDRELGQAELLEDARRDLDAALAVLADAGLRARARQQHADLQRPALRASDVERRGAGEQSGGADTGGEAAAGNACASDFALQFIEVLRGCGRSAEAMPYFSYSSIQDAMAIITQRATPLANLTRSAIYRLWLA